MDDKALDSSSGLKKGARYGLFKNQREDDEKFKLLLKKSVSQDFEIGDAIGEGDCFFDAVAQALNQRENTQSYTVKSLRLLIDDYVKDPKNVWVRKAVEDDKMDYEYYLARVQFTADEMQENDRAKLLTGTATWGRPNIEGRILCEKLEINIHVVECREKQRNASDEAVHEAILAHELITKDKTRSIEENRVGYSDINIIHIVVNSNHFVPILRKSGLQESYPEQIPTSINVQDNSNPDNYVESYIDIDSDASLPADSQTRMPSPSIVAKDINVSGNLTIKFIQGKKVVIAESSLSKLPQSHKKCRGTFPNKNSNFKGREDILLRIREKLKRNKGNAERSKRVDSVIAASYGLGGVGKTQIAVEFVNRYQDQYEMIFWVHAETKDNIQTDFFNFAEELGIANVTKPQDVLKEFKRRLKVYPGNLIVFDNAPNYEAIKDYLPNEGCGILITSQHKCWPGDSGIEIAVFSLQESREYIRHILDKEIAADIGKIDGLASILGYLPLALAQACAYIKQNVVSIERYLELYTKNKKHCLTSSKFLAGDQHNSVYLTFKLSIEQIYKKSDLSPKLLGFCSCLSPDGIPEILLKGFFEKKCLRSADDVFENELGLLNSYSLITIDPKTRVTSIHRLVQEVVRMEMQEAPELVELMGCAANFLSLFVRTQIKTKFAVSDLLIHIDHFLSVIEKNYSDEKNCSNRIFWSDVLSLISSHVIILNTVVNRAKVGYWLKFAEEKLSSFGIDEFKNERAEIYFLLGVSNAVMGKENDIRYYEKACSLAKQLDSRNDNNMMIKIRIYNRYARLLVERGDRENSITMLREIKQIVKSKSHLPLIDRIDYKRSLAKYHRACKELEKSLRILDHLIKYVERICEIKNQGYVDLYRLYLDIAIIRLETNELSLAEMNLKFSEKHAKETFNEGDPIFIEISMYLGICFAKQGRLDHSLQSFTKMVELSEQKLDSFGFTFFVRLLIRIYKSKFYPLKPSRLEEKVSRCLWWVSTIHGYVYGDNHVNTRLLVRYKNEFEHMILNDTIQHVPGKDKPSDYLLSNSSDVSQNNHVSLNIYKKLLKIMKEELIANYTQLCDPDLINVRPVVEKMIESYFNLRKALELSKRLDCFSEDVLQLLIDIFRELKKQYRSETNKSSILEEHYFGALNETLKALDFIYQSDASRFVDFKKIILKFASYLRVRGIQEYELACDVKDEGSQSKQFSTLSSARFGSSRHLLFSASSLQAQSPTSCLYSVLIHSWNFR